MEIDIDSEYQSNNQTDLTSIDTRLWFEFLVNPCLLLPHLKKQKPEPSPTELITKFITVYQNNNTNELSESCEFTQREIALKILALQTAAFLKWDLKLIQSKLPLRIQIRLLEDLIYVTSGQVFRVPKQQLTVDIENVENQHLFAAVLWHRWVVSGLVYRGLQNKTIGNQICDDFTRYLNCSVAQSVQFLHQVIESQRIPQILTSESFVSLTDTANEISHNWTATSPISTEEFHSQLNYDLGTYYFLRKKWKLAKEHLVKCYQLFESIPNKDETFFGQNYLNDLKGYLYATGESLNGHKSSLLYKFYSSIRNGFAGTVTIMQQDNTEKVLPLVHRELAEIETLGTLSSGKYYVAKDILLQFSTSNIIRTILDQIPICPTKLVTFFLEKDKKAFKMLLSTILTILPNMSESDRDRIKYFFINLAPSFPELGSELLGHSSGFNSLFSKEEIDKINFLSGDKIENLPLVPSEGFPTKHTPREFLNLIFEQKVLQHKLINCYDFVELHSLVLEWHKKTQRKSINRINPKWQLPIPLQSVVTAIEDNLVQTLTYLILAKGRELMLAKDYENSMRMYSQIDTDFFRKSTQPSLLKLHKMVSWELLLVQVIRFTDEWPANYLTPEEKIDLISKCKECLSAQQNDYTTNIIPRTELVEHFSLFLLNVGEWEFILGLEKRWNYFELTTAVASACLDLVKHKGAKKLNKDVWDLILPIFGPNSNSQQKRGGSNTNVIHRDSPNAKTKLNILSFMSSLRNENALAVMVSLLARLYNILKDVSSLELIVENISLWPAVVSNANSYNHKSVSEMLWQILEIALQYYPNNVSWLKLTGDVNFCNDYPEVALKCYIKALIVATDYFIQPMIKPLIDDHTIKRMIKSCIEMNCFTQAVVLCQFLDQIDYTTAFQCLDEMKPGNCHDAMDAYYSCIWDTTILEYLINFHHKRGEEHRKREAIRIIGLLELNSNNSEEIKREASDIRKRKFMRALAKQYVIKYPI